MSRSRGPEVFEVLVPTTGDPDIYGGATEGSPRTVRMPGVRLVQASSDEPVAVGRTAVITRDTIFCQPSKAARALKATDRVRQVSTGRVFTIEGEPQQWGHGVVAAVQRVEG